MDMVFACSLQYRNSVGLSSTKCCLCIEVSGKISQPTVNDGAQNHVKGPGVFVFGNSIQFE